MLLPLVFGGAGRISVDDLLSGRRRDRGGVAAIHDRRALALALAVLAVPLLFLLPLAGVALGLAAVGLAWRAASPSASDAATPPAR
jgi:hypothetical protein